VGVFEKWLCKIEKEDFYAKIDIHFYMSWCECSKIESHNQV